MAESSRGAAHGRCVARVGGGARQAFCTEGHHETAAEVVFAVRGRTLEAARIYRLLNPDYVISSGGVVQDDSVGAAMKNTLIHLGVPADRILVEGKSLNTRDEAVMVAAMLPPLKVDHVVLVTSAMHMRRSVGLFRAVGINVIPAIARQHEYSGFFVHLLPSDTGLRTSALAVHEILGITYYRLRGQLK